MQPSLLNEVRRERTRHELSQLRQSVCQWIDDRRAADVDEQGHYMGRHKTQLEAIESVLIGALEVLDKETLPGNLSADGDSGPFFDRCRNVDFAILWLQRVWEYFAKKFEPRREEKRWGPLLKAADEVVWSCYSPIFSNSDLKRAGITQGPTPLPFVEPWFSPASRHSDKPLVGDLELRAAGLTAELADFLRGLPIPLLRLPPWCADAPWWLGFVAHEVGHLVQHEIGALGHFRRGLELAAQRNSLDQDDIRQWGQWGGEIFADVFSILVLGQWALWAIIEVELSSPARMRRRRTTYPAPLVRLALMQRLARELNLPSKQAMRGFDPVEAAGDDPLMARDLGVVEDTVRFALSPLPNNLGTLKELCGFDVDDFRPGKGVDYWAGELKSDRPLQPDRQPRTARLIVAGALQAWSEVMQDPQERANKAASLANRTKEALFKAAPPGTRAASQPSGKVPQGGEQLAGLLLGVGGGPPAAADDELED